MFRYYLFALIFGAFSHGAYGLELCGNQPSATITERLRDCNPDSPVFQENPAVVPIFDRRFYVISRFEVEGQKTPGEFLWDSYTGKVWTDVLMDRFSYENSSSLCGQLTSYMTFGKDDFQFRTPNWSEYEAAARDGMVEYQPVHRAMFQEFDESIMMFLLGPAGALRLTDDRSPGLVKWEKRLTGFSFATVGAGLAVLLWPHLLALTAAIAPAAVEATAVRTAMYQLSYAGELANPLRTALGAMGNHVGGLGLLRFSWAPKIFPPGAGAVAGIGGAFGPLLGAMGSDPNHFVMCVHDTMTPEVREELSRRGNWE